MKHIFLCVLLAGSLLGSGACQTGSTDSEYRSDVDRGPSAAQMERAASRRSDWTGSQAPSLELPDQQGRMRSLADQRGRWVVLYFYPKDDTPGCTCQATEFTSLLMRFENLNAVVWGVSEDSPASHRRFVEKHDLQVTLLSDPDHNVMRAYDAWMDYSGRQGGRAVRTTFLIGPDGTIRRHWPEVIPTGHAERVRDALADLQQDSGQ
ncbi:MAG: peroxiredoxin [Planctomycetota bacterium]